MIIGVEENWLRGEEVEGESFIFKKWSKTVRKDSSL